MKISKELQEDIRFEQALEDVRQVVLYAWQEIVVKRLREWMSFTREIAESEIRYKHNQHMKSTWRINWDTRKQCQVMNNRPVHIIRKVKI